MGDSPKLGALYRFFSGILYRGTWGLGFRAIVHIPQITGSGAFLQIQVISCERKAV